MQKLAFGFLFLSVFILAAMQIMHLNKYYGGVQSLFTEESTAKYAKAQSVPCDKQAVPSKKPDLDCPDKSMQSVTDSKPSGIPAGVLDDTKDTASQQPEAAGEKPPVIDHDRKLEWQLGENDFKGEKPSLVGTPMLETMHGKVPFFLFCKPEEETFGVVVLRLDQIDDNLIRYRRPLKGPQVLDISYDAKGNYLKQWGDFPPSDCSKKNLFESIQ